MRTVLAALTGYITIAVLVFITDLMIGVLFHGSRQTAAIVNMILALPYAVAGGYLAAFASEGKEMAAAIGLSTFGSVIAILMLIRDRGDQPLWYSLALLTLFAVGALGGGYLRA